MDSAKAVSLLTKAALQRLADNEQLHREWQLCKERAEVASQVRSAVTQAASHLDAMREARELHEQLQAASTLAYERYTAALRGEQP
jgi:hypothetical protein